MATNAFNVDKTHTDVTFSAKHMMVTNVRGKFNVVDGTVNLDLENPTASFGSFSVESASIDTGVDQRDGHLRSADFFDADQFPTLTFVSTGVEAKGGDEYKVSGNLTVKNVTRPVTFEVEYLGLYTSMAGARRAGFHATTKINREDFGLTWNVALETGGWLVGKDIKIEIDLAVEETAEVAAAATA
ncbi:MAG: YceI family protein [Chloroflexota bacterium]